MKSNLLKSYIENIGLSLNDQQVEQFLNYESLLVYWNEKINLTAITESSEIYSKHFADSLTCFLSDKIFHGCKIIDVGTGAGFPGIPLKIYDPSIKLTLLDSLNKRINFLKEVTEKLELEEVTFLHGRAEDFGQDDEFREQFDVVVSRAVADLSVLLEFCIPFIKVGGYFISHKGKKCYEEIENAKTALEILNVEIESVKKVKTSSSASDHYIIVMKKTDTTNDKYPRRAGVPIKKHL